VFLHNNSRFHYQAGQYIEFCLPDEQQRPYSIANAPSEFLEFHIKHEKGNIYSEKLVDYIRQNKTIQLTGPFGTLQYHTEPKLPLIFVATGTGLAPCKAIIEKALQDDQHARIELYWGASQKSDLYYHEELIQLTHQARDFNYYPVLESRVYHAVLTRHQDLSSFHLYLSGHQEMVFTAQKLFKYPKYFYSDWLDYFPKIK